MNELTGCFLLLVLEKDSLECRSRRLPRTRILNTKLCLMSMYVFCGCAPSIALCTCPASLMPVNLQRSLETQLATVTDGIDLLKSEIEREEALLAQETKQLQDMEKNAKAAEAERKRQMKNVSSLEFYAAPSPFPLISALSPPGAPGPPTAR